MKNPCINPQVSSPLVCKRCKVEGELEMGEAVTLWSARIYHYHLENFLLAVSMLLATTLSRAVMPQRLKDEDDEALALHWIIRKLEKTPNFVRPLPSRDIRMGKGTLRGVGGPIDPNHFETLYQISLILSYSLYICKNSN